MEVVNGVMEGFEGNVITGMGSDMRVTTGLGAKGMGINIGVSTYDGVAIGAIKVNIGGRVAVNVPIWVTLGRNVVCKGGFEVVISMSGFARKIS